MEWGEIDGNLKRECLGYLMAHTSGWLGVAYLYAAVGSIRRLLLELS